MYYIGIDLGGTVIKIGLVREGGDVVDVARLDADSQSGLRPRLEPMASLINVLMQRNGVDKSELGGLSLAFPGIVNVKEKRAGATNAKYDDAPEVDLCSWAKENWGVPFAIDNDARMAVVGEWLYGAGKGYDNVVMMTIGTGIGTGAIVDGHLMYGKNFCAGSLGGHMIVDWRGRQCTCGNTGCVEAHGSSFFLKEIIAGNPSVSAEFKNDPDNYCFKTIFDKYRAGSLEARSVAEECMNVWSAGIINYIHAYDPQIVILGGGIMKSADIIIPVCKGRVDAMAWQPAGKVEIVQSQLCDNAAIAAAEYYCKSWANI